MALLQIKHRRGFEHDVVHHGKSTTPVWKAAKPQKLPVSFCPWHCCESFTAARLLLLSRLARNKIFSGQTIPYESNML